MSVVYLNGEYVPKEKARISPDDRGFLLADGVYEVTSVYGGRPFRLDDHLRRMERGLRALRIAFDPWTLRDVHRRLLEENGLAGEPAAIVYSQVTRGAAPRTHHFPPGSVPPTVYAFAAPFRRPGREEWGRGRRAITAPDLRWARVDIKSIALLPNVLAQQAAVDAGVDDVLLVREGIALEGSHANFFAVLDGRVVTHPLTNRILPGITRGVVLELARELGYEVEERPILLEELAGARELFLTGTTAEVRPLVEVDGRPVGEGTPGPVTRALYDACLETVGAGSGSGVG